MSEGHGMWENNKVHSEGWCIGQGFLKRCTSFWRNKGDMLLWVRVWWRKWSGKLKNCWKENSLKRIVLVSSIVAIGSSGRVATVRDWCRSMPRGSAVNEENRVWRAMTSLNKSSPFWRDVFKDCHGGIKWKIRKTGGTSKKRLPLVFAMVNLVCYIIIISKNETSIHVFC